MLQARETFYRVAASGVIPATLFRPPTPDFSALPARTGRLRLEIVTHCWKYAHLLTYQLSSVAQFRPTKLDVTMTVFYSHDDPDTEDLLKRVGALEVPGVRWNWQPLPTPHLFRRAIGRNRAGLATTADWIWYTDCDVFFHEGCLDGLADALQGRRDVLLFPDHERATPLLLDDDALLAPGHELRIASVDASRFAVHTIDKAKGAWQITHGDVARAVGYCSTIPLYQTPRTHWNKTYEDRTYRWLLGTEGVAIDVPAIYRIRHVEKGRYSGSTRMRAASRRALRRTTSWLDERSRRRK